MESQPKIDIFAQIATQRESAARATLVEPTPPSLPDRTLPFAADGGRDFRPAPKIGTEADLQAELERQRRRFEPFLRERGRLFVHFNGVDYKAHVFVNGAFLGSHEGFFAPFDFDFTPHARAGTNVLLVKVENDATGLG